MTKKFGALSEILHETTICLIVKNILFLTLIHHIDTAVRSIFYDLVKTLADQGHNVYVVVPSERRYGKKTCLVDNGRIKVLKIQTLNIQKTSLLEKGIGSLLLEYQFRAGVRKYFEKVPFDLVLYSTPPIHFTKVVEDVKRRTGAVSYLLLKDIFPQNAVDLGFMRKSSPLYTFFRREERKMYAVSDFIGCMSNANIQFLLRHNPEIPRDTVEVNPNSLIPIDLSASKEEKFILRAKYQLPFDATIFMYGGNLGKPQGIDFLIEVLNYYQKHPQVFFLIIGAGTEYSKIEHWMKLDKPSNVRLIPKMAKTDYDDIIRACDAGLIFLDKRFTIPNFPSRLLSYLECRLPVLMATDRATDVGQVVADAGAGYHCISGDTETMLLQISIFMSLTEHERTKMGDAAFSLLKQQFDVAISAKLILEKIS